MMKRAQQNPETMPIAHTMNDNNLPVNKGNLSTKQVVAKPMWS